MNIYDNFYFGWFLYNIICLSIGWLYLSSNKRYRSRTFIRIYILLYVLLALFGSSIGPDYLPYNDIVKNISINKKDAFTHLENIYIYIISNFSINYFLFQCIIYITSYIGLYYIFKRFWIQNVNILLIILLFSILGLYSSIISRQTISIIFLFLSAIFWEKNKYSLVILFILLSFYLHKIGVIIVTIFILSIIWKCSLKERIKWFYLLPIFVILGNYSISLYQNWLMNNIHGAYYLYFEEQLNSGNIIWKIIAKYQIYVLILISLYIIYFYRKIKLSGLELILYKILYISSYLGLLFNFMNINEKSLTIRCFTIAVLPVCYFFPQILPSITKRKKMFFLYLLFFYYVSVNMYILRVSFINLR